MRCQRPGRPLARGVAGAVGAAVLCVAVTMSGCTDGGAPVVAGGVTAPPDPTALHHGLPECGALPEGIAPPAMAGLDLPEGMVVTDISDVPPLLQITGLIDSTPVEIRDRYADADGLVHLEDEGFEAEILIRRGDHRVFIRATSRCRTGSVVTLVRAPGDAAHTLPVPGQLTDP